MVSPGVWSAPAAGGPIRRQIDHLRLAALSAQHGQRFRRRVLLARKSLDEAPAAQLAARFEPPVDIQQLAPAGGDGLGLQGSAKHYPVAQQQGVGDVFDGGIARLGVSIVRQKS